MQLIKAIPINLRKLSLLLFTTTISVITILIWARSNYSGFMEAQYDDSFITYRYAWNFWNGNGFNFNPGVPVNSASSPVLVLLLAPMSAFGLEFVPLVSQVIGISALGLSAGICVTAGYSMCKNMTGMLFGVTAGCVLVFNALNIYWSVSGMETALFNLLLLCSLLLTTSSRLPHSKATSLTTLVVLLMLSWSRPEGIALAFIMGAALANRVWRPKGTTPKMQVLSYIFVPSMSGAIYFLWNKTQFDAWLPNPVTFKRIADYYTISPSEALELLAQYLLLGLGVFAIFMGAIGLLIAIRNPKGESLKNLLRLSPALIAFGFFIIFIFLASFGDQYRYLTPISVFVAWAVLQIPGKTGHLKKNQALALILITVFSLLGTIFLQVKMAKRIDASISGQIDLQLARTEMGKWLEKNFADGTRVLSGDLGAIAYYNPSNFYIDSVGLTNSRLISDLLEGKVSYVTSIQSQSPEILVDTVDRNGFIGSEGTYNRPDNYYDQNIIVTAPESTFRDDFVLTQVQLLPEKSMSELLVGAYKLTEAYK